MVGRREIALVVASVGLSSGVVDNSVSSIAIVVTIATTVAAPLLLKAAYELTPLRQAKGEETAFVRSYVAGGQ